MNKSSKATAPFLTAQSRAAPTIKKQIVGSNVRDFLYENSDLARDLRKMEPRAAKGADFDFYLPRLNAYKWMPSASGLHVPRLNC